MLVCRMMWYCYFLVGFKHDDVIKWKHFPRYCPFVRGIHPTQRPVTQSFDVFFDLCLNRGLRKQWWGWWFVTLSRPLWRHRDDVHFNCIVQHSLYHKMDRGTMLLCTLVSSSPSQSIELVFGCALFWCWLSLSAPVPISLIESYFFMISNMRVVTIIRIFMAILYFLNCTFRLSVTK